MVTNNEVLTVSYGTFSCTLEGFDESFDTMKAIAEYFRDLAADDRYFGAEPPTPDAEMLTRIAEHEIERRVQARTEHGAIVLSAKPPAVAAEAVRDIPEAAQDVVAEIPADVPEDKTSPVAIDLAVEDADITAPTEELEAVSEVEAIQEPEIVDVTETVLEAIAVQEDIQEEADIAKAPVEIEAVDAQEIEETASDDVAEDVADGDVLAAMISRVEATDDVAEEVSEIEIPDQEEVQEDTLIADILEADASSIEDADKESDPVEIIEAEVENIDAVAEEMPPVIEAVEDVAPVSVVADDDSIAAKLQRIRAVVSKSADQPDEDDYNEDEHAGNLLDEPVAEISSILTLDGQMAAAAMTDDALVLEDDAVDDVAAELVEAPAQPVRARVVRMKKADFESAVDNGLLEAVPVDDDAYDEDDEFEADLADSTESNLSDEEEAELLAELAQVEAEVNEADLDDEPVEAIGADFEDAPENERPVRARHLTDVSAQTDADMSRLLGEAQNQLNEPGGSRRRQAIAHLRAAVAATKAEKSAGVTDDARDEAEVYRDDLASVVRPVPSTKRPDGSAKSQDDTPRDPAPLKLVAEQRIDTPQEAAAPAAVETPRVPVRPRRVAAVDLPDREAPADQKALGDTDVGSFSEFAESVGANQLHEVLEAAAAYLTYVEGHNVFSRPMVMRMISSMEVEEFTREDSLRGFGQLLRENKIEKVSGGRFTASDEIGFKPEDRAAG